MYFVNLSLAQESIFVSLRFRRLYFGLISTYFAVSHCILYSTINKVDCYYYKVLVKLDTTKHTCLFISNTRFLSEFAFSCSRLDKVK